ncbi:hypothetical protein NliqN6_2281 [Naganishia liquefaciens]|uniref:Peroxisomal membrane protein 11C n=1 Tax=Naganishia liquefaciens TaxID=104408 RepID=A0A8H3TTD5_9TREE|nr:hypothetical protein NliqN6_2281 [Naganishia liquefaciens]
MSLSLTHTEDTDPWRTEPHASTSAETGYTIPTSPRHRRVPSVQGSRKGKEKEADQVEDGIGARLGTMDRLNVLSKVVDSSNGRDKVLKSLQYAAKSYIWLFITLRRSLVLPLDAQIIPSHIQRLSSATSSISLARKCLRLFGPIPPFNLLIQETPLPPSAFFNCILAFLTACADDVVCLSKLGLISKRTGEWADKWANRFWLLKALADLLKLSILRAIFPRRRPINPSPSPEELIRLEKEKQEIWTARKLMCDIVHAGYNVFRLRRGKEPIQTFTGLAAGLISTSQLLKKGEIDLFKAMQR